MLKQNPVVLLKTANNCHYNSTWQKTQIDILICLSNMSNISNMSLTHMKADGTNDFNLLKTTLV